MELTCKAFELNVSIFSDSLTMSALKAQPVSDTLIPVINIIRKIKTCDASQLGKVLHQLPSMFESHGSLPSLKTIITMGLCQHLRHQQLSSGLLTEIIGVLPGDNELDITDSIYQSKLVDDDIDDEEQNDENSTTDHKKQRVPMSLLRVPSDLQFHLFHFLELDDLQNVQKVCRALCVAARNPLSLRFLNMELNSRGCSSFHLDCYSKIESLHVGHQTGWMLMGKPPPIFNGNWSRSVKHLSFNIPLPFRQSNVDPNQSFYFQNVERCIVRDWISPLNLVHSYDSLQYLSLIAVEVDGNMVDQICKFHNLEQLHLTWVRCSDHRSTPITLGNLKDFHFTQYCNAPMIDRILIGSQPSTVTITIEGSQWVEWIDESMTGSLSVDAFRGINNITFLVESLPGFEQILKNQFLPIFAEIQHNGCKPFGECCVVLPFGEEYIECNKDMILPLVKLFQYAQSSKLDLTYVSTSVGDTSHSQLIRDHFVECIVRAPFGTFTDIVLNMELRPCVSVNDQEFWNLFYHRDSAVDPVGFRKYILKIFEEKDKCLEPWLTLDEDTMKRIGIRSIDIKYKCGLRFDDGEDESETDAIDFDEMEFIGKAKAAWAELAPQIMQMRATYWTTRNDRCSADHDCCNKTYSVKLRTETTQSTT